jgi:hypothetical protein
MALSGTAEEEGFRVTRAILQSQGDAVLYALPLRGQSEASMEVLKPYLETGRILKCPRIPDS